MIKNDTGNLDSYTPAHYFGTVLGIAGGIYGLFYAYQQKCGPLGFIGYYLLFSIIGTYGGFVADAIVPISKPQSK